MSLLGKKKNAEPEITYEERRKAQRKLEKEAEKNGEPLTKEQKKINYKADKAEVKRIHAERKALRPQLKKQKIKFFHEFDIFAGEVGLAYPEHTVAATLTALRARASSIWAAFLASITVWKALFTVLLVLGILLYTAYITEEKGHFTVNVTADMLEQGFQISETADFKADMTRLYAQEITNANATSIYEINRNVCDVDGSHNGPGYMAYTFYLRNNGEEVTDYAYTVNILSETMNTAAATWVMFFEGDQVLDKDGNPTFDKNGKMIFDSHHIIYAKPQEDGNEENLYGYPDAPFAETSFDPASQYYTHNNLAGISTVPFIDEYTALQGYVGEFEPGEIKQYTVVIWLEGDDPDCNNSILGGHVGFNVQFDRLGDLDLRFFKGLFRKEFNKSYYVQAIPDIDAGDAGTSAWDGLENYNPESDKGRDLTGEVDRNDAPVGNMTEDEDQDQNGTDEEKNGKDSKAQ